LIEEKQKKARNALAEMGRADAEIDAVWQMFDDDYFLRHRSAEIVWHTAWLADSDIESDVGLVDVRRRADGDGVEAVLYTPRSRRTFAHVTAALDELSMTIVDARIVPVGNGYSIDTYIFMELDKRIEIDNSRARALRAVVEELMLPLMYELPEAKDEGATYVITEAMVEGTAPASLFTARKAQKESA
jgi:[protein-PII] uridylyltransferase